MHPFWWRKKISNLGLYTKIWWCIPRQNRRQLGLLSINLNCVICCWIEIPSFLGTQLLQTVFTSKNNGISLILSISTMAQSCCRSPERNQETLRFSARFLIKCNSNLDSHSISSLFTTLRLAFNYALWLENLSRRLQISANSKTRE